LTEPRGGTPWENDTSKLFEQLGQLFLRLIETVSRALYVPCPFCLFINANGQAAFLENRASCTRRATLQSAG
jgi:hypothetical protein